MHSTHVAVASAARADLQRLYEFYLHRVCGLPRYVPSLCLLCELGLQPLKVYWLRHTLRFWDKLALAPLGSFHKTMMLDNLQDAVRFKVPNFCRSLMATLKHLGHAIPSGYNVLPTIDVDSVVSTEELSLRLPPPVFLDPRSAPSLRVVQCSAIDFGLLTPSLGFVIFPRLQVVLWYAGTFGFQVGCCWFACH